MRYLSLYTMCSTSLNKYHKTHSGLYGLRQEQLAMLHLVDHNQPEIIMIFTKTNLNAKTTRNSGKLPGLTFNKFYQANRRPANGIIHLNLTQIISILHSIIYFWLPYLW